MTTATRRLGRSGLQVTALGLGCWAIGGAMTAGDQPLGDAGVDDADAVAALHRAVELGVDLLDTAEAYGAGHSERLLRGVLAAHPHVRVATKFGNTSDEATRQLTGTDTSPGYVRRALTASLARLGRERLDLYQLHSVEVTPSRAAELVGVLEDLVTEGLIAWWGVSTDDPDQAELLARGEHCTAVQLQLQLQLNVLDDNPRTTSAARRRPGCAGSLTGGPTPPRSRRSTRCAPCSPEAAAPPRRARWRGSGRTTRAPSRCRASATAPRSRTTPARSPQDGSVPQTTRRSRPSWAAPSRSTERWGC